MSTIKNEKYIFITVALLCIGQRIYRVFFTDFKAETWFDNIGWIGVTGLIFLLIAPFWEKLRPYFE
jgi:hypothetical protein